MKTSRSAKLTFLRRWQHTLRLDDWHIQYEEKRWRHKAQWGRTRFDYYEKEATIAIKKGLTKDKWEITLLHELMHLRFPFKYKTNTYAAMWLEQGVELTARALLGRRVNKEKA
jgi:outer membrane protease